jgi:hypothetical protein
MVIADLIAPGTQIVTTGLLLGIFMRLGRLSADGDAMRNRMTRMELVMDAASR